MPGRLPFSDKEARFLKELAKHKVRFMIVGLSAANLQGAPVVTQDIDLWFQDLSDPKIRKALNKMGGIYVPPFGGTPPMFTGDDMALFDIVLTMSGLKGFREEVKNTVKSSLCWKLSGLTPWSSASPVDVYGRNSGSTPV